MKTSITNILGIFVLILILCSCKKDENAVDLIGVWEIYYFDSKNCDLSEDNIVVDLTENNCFMEGGLEVCADISFNFQSETTMVFDTKFESLGIVQQTTKTYEYTISGDEITACDDDGCEKITFDLNDNEITFEWNDPADGCDNKQMGRRF